jgi:hypothetical protein
MPTTEIAYGGHIDQAGLLPEFLDSTILPRSAEKPSLSDRRQPRHGKHNAGHAIILKTNDKTNAICVTLFRIEQLDNEFALVAL